MKPCQLDNTTVSLSINLDDEHTQCMADHNSNYIRCTRVILLDLDEDKHKYHFDHQLTRMADNRSRDSSSNEHKEVNSDKFDPLSKLNKQSLMVSNCKNLNNNSYQINRIISKELSFHVC